MINKEKLSLNILPFLSASKANKKIQESIDKLDTQTFEDIRTFEELKNEYDSTFRGKDKLEDKAKSNIITVTVSATLIMGTISIVNGFLNSENICINLIGVLLFIIAVAYMIIAGINAFTALMEKNTVYTSRLNSEDLDDIRMAIFGNNCYNLIRNNLVSSSYNCIRNSLVCMFFVMLLLIIGQFNFILPTNNQIVLKSESSIYYYSDAIRVDRFLDMQSEIEVFVEESDVVDELAIGDIIGIVNQDLNLFIKLSKITENDIHILLIEKIDYK